MPRELVLWMLAFAVVAAGCGDGASEAEKDAGWHVSGWQPPRMTQAQWDSREGHWDEYEALPCAEIIDAEPVKILCDRRIERWPSP